VHTRAGMQDAATVRDAAHGHQQGARWGDADAGRQCLPTHAPCAGRRQAEQETAAAWSLSMAAVGDGAVTHEARSGGGPGGVWSAHLAAMMFSVLQTVLLWDLNPQHWLSAFLQACAEHGGQSPRDLSAFLPWQMAPERRAELARPVIATLPPIARHTPDGSEPEAGDTS
jgi:hypothetical protein